MQQGHILVHPTLLVLLLLVGVAVYIVSSGSLSMLLPSTPSDQKACTQDAKICPDGSSVGRVGPNCEFAKCPGEDQDSGRVCIQVITPAFDPATGDCKEYPTPCDIPNGWVETESCALRE